MGHKGSAVYVRICVRDFYRYIIIKLAIMELDKNSVSFLLIHKLIDSFYREMIVIIFLRVVKEINLTNITSKRRTLCSSLIFSHIF